VHYRNTWYLDAWCHRSDALRRFALDAIESAGLVEAAALERPLATVEAEMDAGYGIDAGGRRQWATLHFDATAARWASREEWHPQQQGRWLADGGYELRLPYLDATELVMDVLRQGEQVRVVAPASLVQAAKQRLALAAAQYG
jgi:predicted DNA-binding transcriptional regulator YafY